MVYDLHVHSNKSDGKYDRFELLKYFMNNKFEYVSFMDHNYISDLDIYNLFIQNAHSNLKLINGVEFDVSNFKYLHVIGYDIKNVEMVKLVLEKILSENIEICKRLIVNLQEKYNFDISYEELINKGKQISKSSIRDMLVEKGYAKNNLIAGDLYTGKNSYMYEKSKSLTYEEVIKLIKESNGLAFLAHPSTLKMEEQELIKFIKRLKEIGLDGIEVLNVDKTSKKDFILYRNIVRKFNLLESCGSDFHNEISTPHIGIENEISKKLIYKIEGR